MGEAGLDTSIPHSARIYDHLLGGKDNFEADRAAAGHIMKGSPNLAVSMRANRQFMARMAGYVALVHGMRQFLDIGTGLPTAPNLHEVVQDVDPTARVVYVDNDPIVLVHARALLTSTPQGRAAYLDADLADADGIMRSPEVVGTLDLNRPVLLSLIAMLHFMVDDDQVHAVLRSLLAPLAPGSMLAISTLTADSAPDEVARGVAGYHAQGIPARARTREQVAALFDGLELLDPGVCLVHRWHPDPAVPAPADDTVFVYGGVAVKNR
ncbi:MAG TPA: SAM-dependent methyltransferase [Actinoplanes sp.]|nr:SAM-dependent methyltransferase [Actinoplanes sp.]